MLPHDRLQFCSLIYPYFHTPLSSLFAMLLLLHLISILLLILLLRTSFTTTPCLLLLLSLLIFLPLLNQLFQPFFLICFALHVFLPPPLHVLTVKIAPKKLCGKGVINDELGGTWQIKFMSSFNFRSMSACTRKN